MSPATAQGTRLALAVLSVLVMAYSLLIAQQILLGLLIVTTLWFGYLFYHFVQTLSRIATSLERLVDQRVDDAADGWDGRDDG
jgi:hypothetical protein